MEDLKKHGCGIYIDKVTGRRYEGEFEDDIPMGNGRIIFPDGSIYSGGVVKMQRQGSGRMEYADPERAGQKFDGQYEKDQREGVGYHFYPDGRVYCGQFKNDLEEGNGEMIFEKDIEYEYEMIDMKRIE